MLLVCVFAKYLAWLYFQLPYYIDEEFKIFQSNAILRYIGRKYDLGKSSLIRTAVIAV